MFYVVSSCVGTLDQFRFYFLFNFFHLVGFSLPQCQNEQN